MAKFHAKDTPLVSVGMPTFNRPKGIDRALTSIRRQTHENLQIIVSDNASTNDDVKEVIRRHLAEDSRISYHSRDENIGIFANFNFVLSQAEGDYFFWAADDDTWDERYVAHLLESMSDGKVSTAMSDAEVRYYAQNESLPIVMPNLGPEVSAYTNAKRFLRNMQPSIIYGLHRTQAIRDAYSDEKMDFVDCLIVFRLVIRSGVRTVPGALYVAGVQSEKYVPKISGGAESELKYAPAIQSFIAEINSNSNLGILERLHLKILVFRSFMAIKWHLDKTYFEKNGRVMSAIKGIKSQLRILKYGFKKQLEMRWSGASKTTSFAQAGEDLILKFALDAMGVSKPTYLDIGANHPYRYNNSYLFYRGGSSGVNVEPDPALFNNLKKIRKRDRNLNCGVAAIASHKRPFYLMSEPTLNTFSEVEVQRVEQSKLAKLQKTIDVPVRTLNDLMLSEFADRSPDIVSIDVEGLDFELVSSIDFHRYRPVVFCIETLRYTADNKPFKTSEFETFFTQQEYILYADTYVNSIFIDKKAWEAGRS